jgi:hypothetical protein
VLIQTPFRDLIARPSPDGRWLAYQSNESGRYEIYVTPIEGGGKWLVSNGGGTYPRWRGDGRELYYVTGGTTVMAVPVSAPGSAFEAGRPTRLFEARMRLEGYQAYQSGPSYDVTPDGSRFLLNLVVGNPPPPLAITVTTNWTESLAR